MIRRFLFLVDGRANGSRQDAHQGFYRKAANNAKPGFCRAGFQADMAGVGGSNIPHCGPGRRPLLAFDEAGAKIGAQEIAARFWSRQKSDG
jgi:hypothetical protein